VIGVPDAALGEAVHAFVVLRAGSRVTERDVQRQCVGAIEHFMIPKHVEFVDSLPKSANGKIDRRALASAKGQ
jgi:acyl-coenzyme A synthetase/AMP-(fatty) acid ligase